MGAGIRQDLLNKRLYRRLKRLQRELAAEGFLFAYNRYYLTLRIEQTLIEVRYRILRASNGEVAWLLRLTATNERNGQAYVIEPADVGDIVRYVRGEAYCNFITKPIGPALREVDRINEILSKQRRST